MIFYSSQDFYLLLSSFKLFFSFCLKAGDLSFAPGFLCRDLTFDFVFHLNSSVTFLRPHWGGSTLKPKYFKGFNSLKMFFTLKQP